VNKEEHFCRYAGFFPNVYKNKEGENYVGEIREQSDGENICIKVIRNNKGREKQVRPNPTVGSLFIQRVIKKTELLL
jgi:hypothetical protein